MPTIRFTFKVEGVLTDPTSVLLSDPTESFGVKRNDTDEVIVAANTAMDNISTGVYEKTFVDPETDLHYSYYEKYEYLGATYFAEGAIDGATSETALSALVDKVGIVLEDPSFAIFDDTDAIPQAIEQAIMEVSKYVPYEERVEVTLSAGSRDVDVSSLGIKKVLYAEYKQSQNPRQLRNVRRFGDIVSLGYGYEASILGSDKAYLYCWKNHTAATLTDELKPIVVDYAAAILAINHVGDGRTQIAAAVDDVGDAATAVGTAQTAVGDAEGYIANLITALGDIDSEVGLAATALAAQDVSAGNMTGFITPAEADFTSGLGIITAAIAAAEGLFTDVDDNITDAKADIDAASPFNNTITEGNDPEGMKLRTSSSELNLAAMSMAKVRAYLSEISAGATTVAAGAHELSAGQLTGAQASQYRSEASGFLQGASLYASKASQIGGAASHELQVVSAHLSAANALLRGASTRLSVSNVIMSYTRWGEQKLAHAMQSLRDMQKPYTSYTYPEY